jgi:serine/threonine protein kinase
MNTLDAKDQEAVLEKIRAVTKIHMELAIASGSFGSIHPIKNHDDMVVKIILMDDVEDRKEWQEAKKSFVRESQLTRYMGALRIGPEVYDLRAATTYSISLEPRLLELLSSRQNYGYSQSLMYFSILVMERLDTSLFHYCTRYQKTSTETIAQYGPVLIALLRRMTNRGKVCADLKPQNIMVNYDRGSCNVTKIRLIDFGLDWCDITGNRTFRLYKEKLGARQYRTFLFVLMLTTLGFNTSSLLPDHRLGEYLIEYAIMVLKRRGNRKIHIYVVHYWERTSPELGFRTVVEHYNTDPMDIVHRYKMLFDDFIDDGSSSDDSET